MSYLPNLTGSVVDGPLAAGGGVLHRMVMARPGAGSNTLTIEIDGAVIGVYDTAGADSIDKVFDIRFVSSLAATMNGGQPADLLLTWDDD